MHKESADKEDKYTKWWHFIVLTNRDSGVNDVSEERVKRAIENESEKRSQEDEASRDSKNIVRTKTTN